MDIFKTLQERLNSPVRPAERIEFCAAVIVPLITRGESVDLLLERRADNLRRSSGEVSFPGGQVENGELPYRAALRELEEEVGIGEKQVTLLGRLPELARRRRERITPFVCQLEGKLRFKIQEREVAEIFRVPLDYFIDNSFKTAELIEEYSLSEDFPSQYLPQGSWHRRLVHPAYYILYRERLIWGLTAEIIVRLLSFLG